MAKKLIKNYSFTPGQGIDNNLRPDAYSLILQNKTFIIKEIVAYIQNQIDAGDSDYVGYTYSSAKCERDAGYVIDALLHDLRYGGNEEIYRVASTYWDGVVAQIDGNRIPEYEAYQFARDLINTYILTNTLDSSPEQGIETQVIDETKTTESNTTNRVTTLLNNLVSVIQNGLSSLPVLDVQLGRIEVLGKIELEDLLLISNVTDNIVIYNFADPAKGGTVTFLAENTPAYPNATTVNNGVTVIRFKFNTSTMSAADSIQVFLENTELKIRPYDFGTDAIERMRVAQPQAMIDADFEYGLQPTKWQAISMQRGYPATYEISATDLPVISVTTDASTGTSGVGSSLITVTTNGPHGFSVGQPITIRALASSITGFNRAEGTFLIYSVPTNSTFTYYAKAKVGTASGQVLASSTTQLRQADFYTGASIGSATFSVASNGSSGSFTTALQSPSGSNTLTFIGAVPPVGAPLSGTSIATGTQITGSFGPANSDGIIDYRYVKTTYGPSTSSIALTDVTSLSAGMVVGNEDSPNTIVEISSISGDTLILNDVVTVGKTGDENTYTGSVQAVENTSAGGLSLDIDVTSDVYSLVAIRTAGSNFIVGDTVQCFGTDLGGTSPTNDVFFNVDTVDGSGGVTGLTIIDANKGTGTASYTDIAGGSVGSRATYSTNFIVDRAAGFYTLTQFPTSDGADFFVGNRFKIAGTNFEGVSPDNDVLITVTAVNGSRQITSASISGTAVRGDQIPIYCAVTLSENITGAIAASQTITYSSIATIQVDFASNHGLVPGMGLNIAISSLGSNHELAAGPFSVEQITSSTQIRYIARAPGTVDASTTLEGTLYVRPDGFFSHRPFDGGVQLGTGGPQHGATAIRQSKKYIRYQSGKGAMYNTGALFAPSFDIASISSSGTAAGSIITVATDDADHGLQSGSTVRITGVLTTGYNGDYVVSEIIDERTFRIVATTALGNTTATIGSQCQMSTLFWHGAVVRSGPFDDQNGIFFQYNGKQLAVGRRTSTFQIAGTISINRDSNAITGINTRFLDQLKEGDRIVIRGMTHVVASITNNTTMTVTPDWRGVNNISGVKICKVEDLIIPQSEWNLDKCDGTGPSGYNIDVTKMQMIGIQFSWYGAGFIDWMVRGPDGNYVFCHRLKGNNLNTEAYMRTGNAPVRYEVLNEGANSRLNGSIDNAVTTITLESVSDFPDSGTVYIDNELISYSGRNTTQNTLTGCTRSATLTNFAAGAVRSYTAGSAASHNDRQGVVLVSNTTSPIISHWGSAYLIDGLFDEDRGYIFNYASTGNSLDTTKRTLFMIRLAPSVSNAVTGDLGERELLNRAQLLLQSITITSDAQTSGASGIVVEGVLNPQNYPINPSDVIWTGLTSVSQGGQPSFAQIAAGGAIAWPASQTTTDITTTAAMSATSTVPNNSAFNRSSGTRLFYATRASWEASGITQGNFTTVKSGVVLNDAKFPANTTITQVRGPLTFSGIEYYRIDVNRASTSAVNANATVTYRLGGNSATNTSSLFITKASWESSGGTVGTEVSDAAFPANTRIASVSVEQAFGATAYYLVSFTQTSLSAVNASSNVTLRFGEPPYALPGEQVFSFIANPGETETLDLVELKELTTTAIGGRGAFPNGPDVLAINAYKVGGTATAANIILRWGEAQA